MSSVVSTSVPSKSKRAAFSTVWLQPALEEAADVPGLDLLEAGGVGQLQMYGGDADLVVPDGGEVGALLVVVARRVVVDVVADAPALVADLDQLVLVEPAPEPRDPRASDLLLRQVRRVDVEDPARREPLEGDLRQPGGEGGRRFEVQLRLGPGVPGAPDAQRDRDARNPDHDPLQGPRDRPGVGYVVAEVLAVVYPRDDDVGHEVHEPQSDEAHAVYRRPRAGVAHDAVGHLALLDVEGATEGDAPPYPAPVAVRGHGQDVAHLLEGLPGREQPRRVYTVVVGQYYAHLTSLIRSRPKRPPSQKRVLILSPHGATTGCGSIFPAARGARVRGDRHLTNYLTRRYGQSRVFAIAYRGCDRGDLARGPLCSWTPQNGSGIAPTTTGSSPTSRSWASASASSA